jgi:hypothetical protein
MTRLRHVVAAAGVVLVLAVGCSGDDESGPSLSDAARGDDDTSDPSTAAGGDAGAGGRGADADPVHVAQANGPTLVVREAAQSDADELLTLSADDQVGGVVVCVVVQQVGNWVEVRLPSGAVDRTGWVDRDDVALSQHRFRIEVSRSERTLTLTVAGTVTLTAPVAIGPDAPVVGEHLFVKELVRPPDPAGPFGPYAYGLSGSDNRLDDFLTGVGVVAVHGTPDAAALGTDARTGSIAVGTDVITRMVDEIGLPLGTPVDIVA